MEMLYGDDEIGEMIPNNLTNNKPHKEL